MSDAAYLGCESFLGKIPDGEAAVGVSEREEVMSERSCIPLNDID